MARIIRKGQKNPVFCFLLGYAQPEQTMDKQFPLIYEYAQFLSIMNKKIYEYNEVIASLGEEKYKRQLPELATMPVTVENLPDFLDKIGFMSFVNAPENAKPQEINNSFWSNWSDIANIMYEGAESLNNFTNEFIKYYSMSELIKIMSSF